MTTRTQALSSIIIRAGKVVAAVLAILALLGMIPHPAKILGLETRAEHDADLRQVRGLLLCIYQKRSELDCPAYQEIIVGSIADRAAAKP